MRACMMDDHAARAHYYGMVTDEEVKKPEA